MPGTLALRQSDFTSHVLLHEMRDDQTLTHLQVQHAHQMWNSTGAMCNVMNEHVDSNIEHMHLRSFIFSETLQVTFASPHGIRHAREVAGKLARPNLNNGCTNHGGTLLSHRAGCHRMWLFDTHKARHRGWQNIGRSSHRKPTIGNTPTIGPTHQP